MASSVKNHIELCATSRFDLCDEQGIGNYPIWKRYEQLQNVVTHDIDEQYRNFLSKPIGEIDGYSGVEYICWFTPVSKDVPVRLSSLSGVIREQYLKLLKETLSHYQTVIEKLRSENQDDQDAELLLKALKHTGEYEDLIYCFDNKVVATVWGMRPKNITTPGSCIIERNLDRPKQSFTVEFLTGENGTTANETVLKKFDGVEIKKEQIPLVVANQGWRFIGWDQNPNNFTVTGNRQFTALYEKIIDKKEDSGIIESSNVIPTKVPEEKVIAPVVETKMTPPPIAKMQHKVRFLNQNGSEISSCLVDDGGKLTFAQIPEPKCTRKERFTGWDKAPVETLITKDTDFTAHFERTGKCRGCFYYPALFWRFLSGKGCLRWLLWLLLLLLLLLLLMWLFRSCGGGNEEPPFTDHPKVVAPNPWDPGKGMPAGADPNPIDQNPDHPGYKNLPEHPIDLEPIDSSKVVGDDDNVRKIVGNKLNVLLDDESLTITDFAVDFKKAYPGKQYKIVYYDTFVKRLQIEIPANERMHIRTGLEDKLPSKYKGKVFVWDEALFESNYKPNDERIGRCWYLNPIKVFEGWDITQGNRQIKVAIVDDGFSLSHEEFKGKIYSPYNVFTHTGAVSESRHKHGTHVAGTALALANNRKGISGIAPNCTLIPVQVADPNGFMTSTSVLDGVLYAVYKGADVINLSLGMCINARLTVPVQEELIKNHFKEEERLWGKVFEITRKNNVTVVLAAGNDDLLAGIEPMQRSGNVIVVAAVDKTMNAYIEKSRFSNYGQYTGLSAPGVDIYSTVGQNDYMSMDGTSMAAPIVTGAVALMKSVNKGLTPLQIKTILQETATPVKGNIGKLLQLGPALKRVKHLPSETKDTLKMKDVMRGVSSLNGLWKSSTTLYSQLNHQEVVLYFRFNNGNGTLELIEDGGAKYSARIKAWVEKGRFNIKQQGMLSCNDGSSYSEYAYKCFPDQNGNVVTMAMNQSKNQEVVKFNLIKIK